MPTAKPGTRTRAASIAWAEELGRRAPDVARIVAATRSQKAAQVGVDVDDLIQETLLRAWLRGGTPAAWNPSRSAFSTWIVRVADDTLRTEYRRCVQRHAMAGLVAEHCTAVALEQCDETASDEEFEAELALLIKREAACSG